MEKEPFSPGKKEGRVREQAQKRRRRRPRSLPFPLARCADPLSPPPAPTPYLLLLHLLLLRKREMKRGLAPSCLECCSQLNLKTKSFVVFGFLRISQNLDLAEGESAPRDLHAMVRRFRERALGARGGRRWRLSLGSPILLLFRPRPPSSLLPRPLRPRPRPRRRPRRRRRRPSRRRAAPRPPRAPAAAPAAPPPAP